MSFADLGISRPVVDALAKRGITAPFAIQELVARDVLDRHDVLVQSPTGSGKTLAFGLPLVERIKPGDGKPAALIVAPTRELALQIVDELDAIAAARSLRIAPVYGGAPIERQAKRAAKAQIIVATPGRLEDLLERRVFSLAEIRMLVLDEADRMLDMGFRPAIDRIVAATPRRRQTLFFSATLEAAAGKVARSYTRDARRHVHEPVVEDVGEIDHRFVHLAHEEKIDALVAELGDTEGGRTLVFVRTKRGADRLVKRLSKKRLEAVAMHGDKSQNQRQRALRRFAAGEVDTLVATDVAARGIDVDDVTHVINFDAPEDRDAYVHRVGRTGRAGRDGSGISFVMPDQDSEMRKIAKSLGLAREFDHERPAHVGSAPAHERPPQGHRRRDGGRHGPPGGQGRRKPAKRSGAKRPG